MAHPTKTCLYLLVDSTIKMIFEGEWREFAPLATVVGATLLDPGDAPILRCLLDQIGQDEKIASVSGDGVNDPTGCHEAIARRGA